MVKRTARVAGASVTVAVMALTGTGAASAADADGPAFGEHVVTCVQAHGFSATENPGTHSGFAGWDPQHLC